MLTQISARFTTISVLVTIILLPPAAFARGGGHSGGAAFSKSVTRLDAPVVRDHRGGNAKKVLQRPCASGNHTHTPDGGCKTNTGAPIVRDHRSPR
jgi:hypothetical protein